MTMEALSATELAALRAAQEVTLIDTCTRRRPTTGHSDLGEATASYADKDYPCRVAAPRTLTRQTEEAAGVRIDAVATFAHDADVDRNDHVLHGGLEYRVEMVQDTTYKTALRVLLERVKR